MVNSDFFDDGELVKESIEVLRLHEKADSKNDLTKDGFINELFGYQTTMTKEEFIQKMTTPKFNWVFDQPKITQRVMLYMDDDELRDEVLEK